MDWMEICVHTSEEAAEAVSFFLLENGLEGVVLEDSEVLRRKWEPRYGEIVSLSPEDYPEEGVRVKGYVSPDEDVPSIIQKVDSYLHQLATFGLDPGPKTITTQLLTKEVWTEPWKQYLHPIQVTERMLVKPVDKEAPTSHDDPIVIELNPGLAFGTGHHITTIQSLQLLEKYIKPESHVIDVGCGSGILSIAAAKLGAAHVLAIDLDPIAVEETRKQIQLNQLEHRINVEQGDGVKTVAEEAHLIVANLIAEIHLSLIKDLPRVLVDRGIFIAAGILKEKEDVVIERLQSQGFRPFDRKQEQDWIAIAAEKW